MVNSTNTAKVSFIVPCYNYGNFLKECLESIRSQSLENWECIIVDNASTDNTKEVADAFVQSDTRFNYFYTEKKGVSHARNMAVAHSCGDYILPLDADDRIGPLYAEKALKVMETNNSVKVTYCNAELFGASSGKWVLPEYSFSKLLIENSIFCSALFRKADFLKAGGFNENMMEGFEDWDFWIRLLKDGGEVYRLPEVMFFYRIRSQSRNSVIDAEKQLILRKRIFENHRELYERHFKLPELIFENYKTGLNYNSVIQSADYKLGRLILTPLRRLRNFIFQKQG